MQRGALGLLFGALAAALIATAVAALAGAHGNAGRWLIAGAALALAVWLGSLAFQALRRRR